MEDTVKITAEELKGYIERIENLNKKRGMCKITFVMYMQKPQMKVGI